MYNILSIFLCFLSILSSQLQILKPPTYHSFTSSNNSLKIKAEINSYTINYSFDLGSNWKTCSNGYTYGEFFFCDIDCSESNVTMVIAKVNQDESAPNTFFCADVPGKINNDDIKVFVKNKKVISIGWKPPIDNGGMPIIGYIIKIQKDEELMEIYNSINKTNSLSLKFTYIPENDLRDKFNITVFAVNQIVELYETEYTKNVLNAGFITIEIPEEPEPNNTKIIFPSSNNISYSKGDKVKIELEAVNSNSVVFSDGFYFMLNIRNYCKVNKINSFLCDIETNTSSVDYVEPIFEKEENFIFDTFIYKEEGYSVEENILAKGSAIARVFQLFNGALLSQFYNNSFLNEPYEQEFLTSNLYFRFEENEKIFLDYSQDISIRFYGAIQAPDSDNFTFSVNSDDGAMIKINGKKVFEHLCSPCDGTNCTFYFEMEKDKFYHIEIVYVQKEGPARFALYWSSTSIGEEIIPNERLYYYKEISNSPITLNLNTLRLLYPPNCIIKEEVPKQIQVGKELILHIIPFDKQNSILTVGDDISNEIFNISFQNDDEDTKKGNIYLNSIFESETNIFRFIIIPTLVGSYHLKISAINLDIKNSPFSLYVTVGEPSHEKSYIYDNVISDDIKAGEIIQFHLKLLDIHNNEFISEPIDTPNIKVKAIFDNDEGTESQCDAQKDEYLDTRKEYSGGVSSNKDGTYNISLSILRAGKYNVSVTLNDIDVKNSPFQIGVVHSEKPYPLKFVLCTKDSLSNVKAGTYVNLTYQMRDPYGNNILKSLEQDVEKNFQLVKNDEVSLSISDVAYSNGSIEIKYKPTKVGEYTSINIINNLEIPKVKVQIVPNDIDENTSTVELINPPEKNAYTAGDEISVLISFLDKYNNPIFPSEIDTTKISLSITNENFLQPVDISYINEGQYRAKFSVSVVGTYNLIVNYNSDNNNIGSINFSVIPGLVSEKSILIANEEIKIKAGNNIIGIKAKGIDIYNNIVSEQGTEIMYIDISNNNLEKPYLFLGEFNKTEDSTYYFPNIYLLKSGLYKGKLKIINSFGLRGSYYSTIDSQYLFKYRYDKVIDFDLEYDAFFPKYPNKLISVEWNGYLKAPISGLFTISFSVLGQVILYISNQLVINYSGPGNTNTQTPNYVTFNMKEGELIPLKLIYKKDEDLLLTRITMFWESDSIQKQVIPLESLYSEKYALEGNDIEKSINITVESANITGVDAVQILTENYNKSCKVNSETTIEFDLFDEYGNLLNEINTDDRITVTISNIENNDIKYEINDIQFDKHYTFKYNINVEGEFKIEFNIINSIGKIGSISNFHNIICEKEITESVPNEISIILDTQSQVVGEYNYFNVSVKDQNNNSIVGNNININIEKNNDNEPITNIKTIICREDKVYIIRYLPLKIGEYNIIVNVGNKSNTKEIKVIHGPPSNIHSKYSFPIKEEKYIMEKEYNFNINIFDNFDNPITEKDLNIYSLFTGKFGSAKGNLTYDENTNSYNISFVIPRKNSTFSGCGTVILRSYILMPGVSVSFFNNFFLSGQSIGTSIYNTPSVIIPKGALIFDKFPIIFSSIKIDFFFKADSETEYTFVFQEPKNDIRVFFDNVIVADSFGTVKDSLGLSYIVNLKKNEIYRFTINLFISYDEIEFNVLISSEGKLLKPLSNVMRSESDIPVEEKRIDIEAVSHPGKIEKIYEDKENYNESSVSFKWEKPYDDGCDSEINYTIYKNDSQDGIIQPSSKELFYTDTDSILKDNRYIYNITAKNNYGESEKSYVITYSSILPTVNIISLFVEYDNIREESAIILKWTCNENVNKYEVILYDITNDPDKKNGILVYEGNETEVKVYSQIIGTDKILFYGHEYSFKITPFSVIRGEGKQSNTDPIMYGSIPGTPKKAPIIDISKRSETTITFSFQSVTNSNGYPIIGYLVYFNEEEYCNTTLLYCTIDVTEPYTKMYFVKYKAVNAIGEGKFSPTSEALYGGVLPDPPINIKKNEGTIKGFISLSWSSPPESIVLSYNLYFNSIFIARIQYSTHSYSHPLYISPSEPIKVQISSINIIGEGNLSEPVTLSSSSIPGPVQHLKLKGNSSFVQIEWSPPDENGGDPIIGYEISLKLKGEEKKKIETTNLNVEIKIEENDDETNEKYEIMIRANNTNGWGKWSNPMEYYFVNRPGKVKNLEVKKELSGKKQAVIVWEKPDEGDHGCDVLWYNVYSQNDIRLATDAKMYYVLTNDKDYIQFKIKVSAVNCAYEGDTNEIDGYFGRVPNKMAKPIFVKYDECDENSLCDVYLKIDTNVSDNNIPIYQYTLYNETNTIKNYLISDIINSDQIIVSNQSKGVNLFYSISASNAVGEGEPSEKLKVILCDKLKEVKNFIYQINTDGVVKLKWETDDTETDSGLCSISGYRIYMSERRNENNYIYNNNYLKLYDTNLNNKIKEYKIEKELIFRNEYFFYIAPYNYAEEGNKVSVKLIYALPYEMPYEFSFYNNTNKKLNFQFKVSKNNINKYYLPISNCTLERKIINDSIQETKEINNVQFSSYLNENLEEIYTIEDNIDEIEIDKIKLIEYKLKIANILGDSDWSNIISIAYEELLKE